MNLTDRHNLQSHTSLLLGWQGFLTVRVSRTVLKVWKLFRRICSSRIWFFFLILAFSTNFCPIKTDLSGNTVCPQASVFHKDGDIQRQDKSTRLEFIIVWAALPTGHAKRLCKNCLGSLISLKFPSIIFLFHIPLLDFFGWTWKFRKTRKNRYPGHF